MTDHGAHGPAVTLITRVLARARDDGADDDWPARAVLTALMGHGWRRAIEPPPAAVTPVPATAEFLAARAAIQQHEGSTP